MPIQQGGLSLPPPKAKKKKSTATPVSAATQTPTYAGYLTPAQQVAQARAQAVQGQAGEAQSITRQQQESARLAAGQTTTATEGARALADLLKGIAPATQAAYTQGGNSDAVYASGLARGQEIVQGQTRDEAAPLLAASGGEAQAPSVNAAIGGANVTGPLYNLGGYIPASTMAREGAAYGAAAARLPATALLSGRDEATAIAAQQTVDQAKLGGQRIDLAAKLPGETQKALTAIQNYQIKLGSAAAKQANDDRKFALDQWAKEAGVTGIIPGTNQLTLAGKKAVQAAVEAEVRAKQADVRLANDKVRISEDIAHHRITESQGAAQLSISQQNANTSAYSAVTARANAVRLATKDATAAKTAKGKKAGTFTTSDVAALADDISGWKTGITGTSNGQPVVGATPLTWNDAYTRALTRLPGNAAGRTKALKLVNAEYGTPDSIALQTVQVDKNNNTDLTQATAHILEAVSTGKLPVPIRYAVDALTKTYGAKPGEVAQIIRRLTTPPVISHLQPNTTSGGGTDFTSGFTGGGGNFRVGRG